jgi:hypothetical protein
MTIQTSADRSISTTTFVKMKSILNLPDELLLAICEATRNSSPQSLSRLMRASKRLHGLGLDVFSRDKYRLLTMSTITSPGVEVDEMVSFMNVSLRIEFGTGILAGYSIHLHYLIARINIHQLSRWLEATS